MTGKMGERFVQALAAKDFEGITSLLHPNVSNADGEVIVDQQAYYETADGAITWVRVLCSGWRRLQDTGTPA